MAGIPVGQAGEQRRVLHNMLQLVVWLGPLLQLGPVHSVFFPAAPGPPGSPAATLLLNSRPGRRRERAVRPEQGPAKLLRVRRPRAPQQRLQAVVAPLDHMEAPADPAALQLRPAASQATRQTRQQPGQAFLTALSTQNQVLCRTRSALDGLDPFYICISV